MPQTSRLNAGPSQRPTPRLRMVRAVLLFLIVLNTLAFFVMAVLGRLNVEGKALVFVDFWGRVTAYSVWFIAYETYRVYVTRDRSVAAV